MNAKHVISLKLIQLTIQDPLRLIARVYLPHNGDLLLSIVPSQAYLNVPRLFPTFYISTNACCPSKNLNNKKTFISQNFKISPRLRMIKTFVQYLRITTKTKCNGTYKRALTRPIRSNYKV